MTLKMRNKSVVQLSVGTFCEIITLVAFKCEDWASFASIPHRLCVLAKVRVGMFFFLERCSAKYILNNNIVSHNVFAVHPE